MWEGFDTREIIQYGLEMEGATGQGMQAASRIWGQPLADSQQRTSILQPQETDFCHKHMSLE